MRSIKRPLRINGEDIFSFAASEGDSAPFRLSAQLFDKEGAPVIVIVDNEWRTHCENWDVQAEGRKIAIRRGPRDIVLELRVEPPNRLVVERLDMLHRGVKISCREGKPLTIDLPDGSSLITSEAELAGFDEGIVVEGTQPLIGRGGLSFSTNFKSLEFRGGPPRSSS